MAQPLLVTDTAVNSANESESTRPTALVIDDTDNDMPLPSTFNKAATPSSPTADGNDGSLLTPMMRKILRIFFVLVNVFVCLYSAIVFVNIMQEIDREEAVDKDMRDMPATPIPTATLAGLDYNTLSWKERYLILCKEIFGSSYRVWVDIYFATIIVGGIVGALGAHLRYASMLAVAFVLYLFEFVVTCVVTAQIRSHNADLNHQETLERYQSGLTWCGCMITFSLIQVGLALHLSLKMHQHKADRYRAARQLADEVAAFGEISSPLSPSTADIFYRSLQRPGKLHKYTTDASTTPAQKRAAKLAQQGKNNRKAVPITTMVSPFSGARAVHSTVPK